ncbi:zinc dependent phospholipase C family protein [Solibacillus sp. MA9]|uniref:Zinc dependent phospholipase C family protein n=1 Tax=Solibacillus palustris TaxID=2908203 RepID=A0ABS9UHN3_9BACL|nr:zinc dependent phospholipase C family protein [Solibacillus sp. MA9]MCH7323758.1 zinc dependent phospholipase C family protein [Solibacillus sp. MA9]
MGSRIMHAIIAYKVADALHITNKTEFILGGIAADASSNKEASHFYTGKHEEYTRRIDYESFIKKYNEYATNDFILGYFAHLIADEYWLQGFYLPWLKNRIESNAEVLPLYHQDFQVLNTQLIHYYNLKDELINHLTNDAQLLKLDEVQPNEVMHFARYVIEDMKDKVGNLHPTLNVFTLEQIIGYIETSTEKSIYLIQQNRAIRLE